VEQQSNTAEAQLARSIFREFRARPESQFIASEFALRHLAEFLSSHPVNSVLEIGAGIGTVTKLLLMHPRRPARIVSTEAVPLCIDHLMKNLAGIDRSGWTLVRGIEQLGTDENFNLVIFDCTLDAVSRYGFFEEGTWCFVEGNRRNERAVLADILRPSGLTIDMHGYFPGGYKVRLARRKKPWLIPLPKLQIKKKKGCYLGRVEAM
jgi:protein-L-isoaspartate O-methyltransferase